MEPPPPPLPHILGIHRAVPQVSLGTSFLGEEIKGQRFSSPTETSEWVGGALISASHFDSTLRTLAISIGDHASHFTPVVPVKLLVHY